MDLQTKRLMAAAAGAGSDPLYLNDYFNLFAYEGNATNRSIVTNIDMTDGKSMVWIKNRESNARHNVQDTVRGAGKLTKIGVGQAKAQNSGDHADHWAGFVSAFNNNGFSLEKDGTGTTDWLHVNKDNDDYMAWTFKACKGFFDIVTFSTDGTITDNNRRISHDLEAVPGMIWCKRLTGTDTGYDYHWNIYHRNNGRGKYQRPGEMPTTSSNAWGTSNPTTTDFGIKESVLLHTNSTYVAYVFAAGDSDAEVFGEGKDQEVIKCGSIGMSGTNDVNTGSNGECSINLGWEPDFVWIQGTEYQYAGSMRVFDRMRGVEFLAGATSTTQWKSGQLIEQWLAETSVTSGNPGIRFTSTGFDWSYGGLAGNANNGHTWMAIRKADGLVGKPPTGTDAFHIASGNFNAGPPAYLSNNFPVEFAIQKDPVNVQNVDILLRDMGHYVLSFNNNYAQSGNSKYGMDHGNGIMNNNWETTYKAWMWRGGPGLDVTFHVGNGGSGHAVPHNLGVIPEMIIAKNIEKADDWMVYHKGLNGGTSPQNYYVRTNNTGGEATSSPWSSAPDAMNIYLGNDGNINESGDTSAFILFSSVEGFSKVGSYTGNGSTQSITCGFSPKMVMIKSRSTNPFMMLDTVRGWGSGDDYALKFTDPWGHTHTGPPDNNQDFGAPTSTGFDLTNNSWPNANNVGYIYYAVA